MHAIVVGCGRLGSELAVALERGGHSVSIIDKNKPAFERYLPADWTGRAVVGFGFDREALAQAGIDEAQAVAAVTGGDNSNIMAARIAKETYQVPNVVARIQDPRRAVLYQQLGISTVASVSWATDQVMRRLLPETTTSEWVDSSGAIRLVERAIPAKWAGQKLAELSLPGCFGLVSLIRNGQARLAQPEVVGQEGDILHLMVTTESTDDLEIRLTEGPVQT